MADITFKKSELSGIVERHTQALDTFVESIMETSGISKKDAISVRTLYFNNNLAKLDIGVGRVRVIHGRLLEKETILHAVDMAKGK